MAHEVESKHNLFVVIGASSAGTLIEWYDFYIFGSLATIIATQFFPKDNPTAAFLSTLATFAAGFVVRPFGAIFFGRLGDIIGRKYTFLVTLLLMGGSTFAIGLVPDYDTIGVFAPIIVLVLRLLQGLALGGEYGGAATYVAEHAPDARRGYYTSWIQTTATLGLFVSLGVILGCRLSMGEEKFASWGWRVPFILSIVLVLLSYVLRMKLRESPLFQKMKAAGKGSKNPLGESFGNWANLKLVLLALFGATAGQGVVWYTGQFYALTFLQKSLSVDMVAANTIIAGALVVATPFFIVFGGLSDRIGRKPIMMIGCLLAILTYLPIYHAMAKAVDLSTKTEVVASAAEPAPGLTSSTTTTDDARDQKTVINKSTKAYTDGTRALTTTTTISKLDGTDAKATSATTIKPGRSSSLMLGLLVFVQVLYVTMVYGPIAAFLVELFPTRIRYTSMSLPYHIGNGVFGGLVPFIATWLASSALAKQGGVLADLVGGPMFVGLLYPMTIAAMTLAVGTILVRETKNRGIEE
ncbi:MAG: MHS family MFS transporter [Phycisphaerae bacterium]|nr:MHS family MFS transporter [Phycisphaerae bacterium]